MKRRLPRPLQPAHARQRPARHHRAGPGRTRRRHQPLVRRRLQARTARARPASPTSSSTSCSRAVVTSPRPSTSASSRAPAASSTPPPTSTAPTTSRRCRRTRSSWACGSRPTAWPRCSMRCRQENLDNQRDVVKNEKRQSYDNRPYGSFYEKLMAAVFPAGHPYHHTPIGSMEDLDAASLDDVEAFFRTYYVPNNAVLTVAGDVDEAPVLEAVERYFGPIEPNEALAGFRLPEPGGPSHPRGRARRRAARARPRGLSLSGLRHARVRCPRGGHPDPGRRSRQPPAQAAGARGARRPGRGPVRAAAGGRLVDRGGLGHGSAGVRRRDGRGHPRRGAAAHDP